MKRLLIRFTRFVIGAILLVSLGVFASQEPHYVFVDQGGNIISLFVSPCTNQKVLANVPEEHRDKFKASTVKLDGVVHNTCWAITLDEENVFFVFEDGDGGMVPAYVFTKANYIGI